jgi:hypothetical protein
MIHASALGDFVGAQFPIPSLHMGGLGDFVTGSFPIPSVHMALSGFVPGRFPVPQSGLGDLGCEGHCGCGGKCGGLGDTTTPATDSNPLVAISDTVQTWWAGLTQNEVYLVYGAGAVAAFMLFLGKGGRRR